MELSVARQTLEFLLSAALGAGLGAVYDIIRLLRGRIRQRVIVAVTDLLFWMIAAAGVMWYAMTVQDGELRLFAVLGLILGAAGYFLLLSPLVLRVGFAIIDQILRILRFILAPIRKIAVKSGKLLKKFMLLLKKHFQSSLKRSMIPTRDWRFKTHARKKTLGGPEYETRKDESDPENHRRMFRGLRRSQPSESTTGYQRGEKRRGRPRRRG